MCNEGLGSERRHLISSKKFAVALRRLLMSEISKNTKKFFRGEFCRYSLQNYLLFLTDVFNAFMSSFRPTSQKLFTGRKTWHRNSIFQCLYKILKIQFVISIDPKYLFQCPHELLKRSTELKIEAERFPGATPTFLPSMRLDDCKQNQLGEKVEKVPLQGRYKTPSGHRRLIGIGIPIIKS